MQLEWSRRRFLGRTGAVAAGVVAAASAAFAQAPAAATMPTRRSDPLPDVLVEWIEANVEIHRVDSPGLPSLGDEPARFGGVQGQRLLAHHVLARRQDCRGLRDVEVVGRGDMNNVDR